MTHPKKLRMPSFSGKFKLANIYTLITVVAVASSGIILQLLLTRFFGVSQLGFYLQLMAIFYIFATAVLFGLNRLTVKLSAELNSTKANGEWPILVNSWVVVLFNSFILLTALAFLERYTNFLGISYHFLYFFPLALTIPIYGLNMVYQAYLNGKRRMIKFCVLRILRSVLALGGLILTVSLDEDLRSFFYSYLLIEVLLLVLNGFWVLRSTKQPHLFALSLSSYYRQGWKLLLSQLSTVTTEKGDVLIVSAVLGREASGVYGFTMNFVNGAKLIAGAIQQNCSPIIANLSYKDSVNELKEFSNKMRKYSWYGFGIITVAIIFGYTFIVQYIVKRPQLNEYMIESWIMLFASLFYGASGWLGGALAMIGEFKLNLYRTVLILIFTLFSIFCFSNFSGLFGVSIAILVSSLFSCVILNYFLSKTSVLRVF